MSDEDTTLELEETRRNVVKGLAVGAGGLALPSLSADTAAAATSVGPYASDTLRYAKVKRQENTYDYSGFMGYTPTDTSHRVEQTTVGHSGPQRQPLTDEVEYTFLIKTTSTCTWLDANGEYHSPHNNILQLDQVIDYPDDVSVDFPDKTNDEYAGSLNLQEDRGEEIEKLTDDDTVHGVLLNFAIGELKGKVVDYVPGLSEVLKYYNLVTDVVSATQDSSMRTVTFNYNDVDPPFGISTYRKFTVTMPENETATLTFDSQILHARKDYQNNEFSFEVTLNPREFLKDIGTHPFEHEIRDLASQTGISGYENDPEAEFAGRRFKPEGDITRAQFASMIDDAFEPNPASTETFSDIGGHWAEEKIERVAGAGYISGYPDGTFRPDQNITKHEVWLALHAGRNYGSKYNGTVTDLWEEFVDVNELPTWDGAREAVANVLAAWGDIENYPDQQKLEPNKNATRAEAAKYIYEAAYLAGEIV